MTTDKLIARIEELSRIFGDLEKLPANIRDNGNDLTLMVLAPGLSIDEIKITVGEDGFIVVETSPEDESIIEADTEEGFNVLPSAGFAYFSPTAFDLTDVVSGYHDGIITVSVKKAQKKADPKPKARIIPVMKS